MPELPEAKYRPPLESALPCEAAASSIRYAELHCKTNFSFLEGASHPDELVATAHQLQYAALAITDRNSLAGVVRAHAAAEEVGAKLLIGTELELNDAPPVVVLSTDRAAYGRLCRLLTTGRRRAPKGECDLALDDLAAHRQGLVACVIPGPDEANSPVDPTSPVERPVSAADLHRYREIFGDDCYLLAELHYGADDVRRLLRLQQLANEVRLPLAASGDVHYHRRERMPLQHVMTAIRHNTTVSDLGARLAPNAERHLRRLAEIETIFSAAPDAIERTAEIADRCSFSLAQLRYEYPEELAPPGETPAQYLRRLAIAGARHRYHGQLPEAVRKQLDYELNLIADLRYEAFFLTVHDLVAFAKSRGILCQGRGSAANSTVCFCLGVTEVDPLERSLFFERFVSRERDEAPDIDVDFEHERREEVLQYVYEKYGRDRAGMTAEVITYRLRSAVRDVGKALGLSLDRVDELAKNVDYRSEPNLQAERCRQSGIDPDSRLGRQLFLLVNELLGFPRHLSQHVGGMVITQGPLCELTPIENAAMADRTVVQWDKDDLDKLGILKVDCLALGMLTAIHKCFNLVELHDGHHLEISSFQGDDPDVYAMISRAETIGVFQIESRAQMSMLPRLKPNRFYDLVIEVAIVRPGPIQGDMVHPYLRRREGLEEVTFPSEEVRGVLERTLGVPLFQEQAMQLAVVAAGFSPGEADQLRRAMGAWRKTGVIDKFRAKLIDGMLAKGYEPEFAERLFNQIRGFGEYGFPESHAASFAVLVYVSACLKYYYPAAFTASLLNSQPMGFYAPAQLIRDVRRQGVEVRPIDVGRSDWDCTLEPHEDFQESRRQPIAPWETAAAKQQLALRLGMRLIRGLPHVAAETIVQHRTQRGPFRSVADMTQRCQLSRAVVERLAEADAFGSLKLDRRQALWEALDQPKRHEDLPLWAGKPSVETVRCEPNLPELAEWEQVMADYRTAGLTLRRHPLSFYREELEQLGVTTAEQLTRFSHNQPVKVAGVVLMRQRPSTAKGITFVTLEDESGTINLVIHTHVWDRYDVVARRSQAVIAQGRLERKNEVIHVVVKRLEDMTERLDQLRIRSRDFR